MISFKKFNELTEFQNKGICILEISRSLGLNDSTPDEMHEMHEVHEAISKIDDLIQEVATPDVAMSKTLKKDVVSMSKANLEKIIDTFVKLIKQEYAKTPKAKQRYLGRVRFINDSGMVSEYPILTISKEAVNKIKANAEAGKSKTYKMAKNQIRVMVNKKGGWRVITTDRILGLVFRGKLYTLKSSDNTEMTSKQSTSLADFAEKGADIKAQQIEKLRNYLLSIGVTNEDDLPRITTKGEIRKGLLSKITDDKVKGIKDLKPVFKLYSIAITGYNYKTREVTVSIKLDLYEIIRLKFGVGSIKLSDNPQGTTKAQWKLNIKDMKEQIIDDIQSYDFKNIKIGTKYINIEVKG